MIDLTNILTLPPLLRPRAELVLSNLKVSTSQRNLAAKSISQISQLSPKMTLRYRFIHYVEKLLALDFVY